MTSPPYPKFVGDDELSIEAAFGDADPFGVTWVAAHFRPGDNALMNHG